MQINGDVIREVLGSKEMEIIALRSRIVELEKENVELKKRIPEEDNGSVGSPKPN